jgi:hypothetical protein
MLKDETGFRAGVADAVGEAQSFNAFTAKFRNGLSTTKYEGVWANGEPVNDP